MCSETLLNSIEGIRADTGEPVRLTIDGHKIESVETIDRSRHPANQGDVWIAPGLIDLQVNGYGGQDVNLTGAGMRERAETVMRLVRKVLASGTTTFCPTVITAEFSQIIDCMTSIRLACEQDPLTARTVAGIHLEGPYLSAEDGPRGAHPKDWVKDPDWDEFMRWQEASGARIRIVTLAPERKGSIPFIRKLTEHRVLVSIGHTAAGHDDIAAAVEAGARMSTHLGNGAHPQLPRHPNYIWSQLAEDRLAASIICDGHHLHPSVVKVMSSVKGNRLVLVSDAVHLAGLKPGKYRTHVGGEVELLPSGRLQMAANPQLLAGAAVSLANCVERYVQFTNATLAEALQKATEGPAQLLGLTETGRLETGQFADFMLFHWDGRHMRIQTVIKRGQIVDC